MDLGNRLRRQLEALGMTQIELAKKLGISPSTLNGYFTGYREPDTKMLVQLSEKLDVSVDYLLTGKNNDKEQKKEPTLSSEQSTKIGEAVELFDKASPDVQEAVLGALRAAVKDIEIDK